MKETRDEDAREREVSQERGIIVRFLCVFFCSHLHFTHFLFRFASLEPYSYYYLCYLLLVRNYRLYWPHAKMIGFLFSQ